MKMARIVIGLILTAALAQTAAAQNFQADLQQANTQRVNSPPAALASLDRMAATYKDPKEQREIQLLRLDVLLRAKKFSDVPPLANKVIADYPQDKEAQATALLTLGDALRGLKKFDEAVQAYQNVAKTCPALPEKVADALLRAGDTLVTDLKKYPEALVAYRAAETQPAGGRDAADALKRIISVTETQTREPAAAAAACAMLVEKYPTQLDESGLAATYAKGVDQYKAAGKLAEAVAFADKAEKAFETATRKAPFAVSKAKLLVELKKQAEARAECDRIICAYPLELEICQGGQAIAVETYRAEGKFAEALGAARILYDAAGTEAQIKAAAGVVGQCFRSVDGNLGRANDFLAWQRYGAAGADGKPGTADDVKANPLTQVAYPPADAARDKLFQGAIAAQAASYDGHRAKGFLSIYWGKPKDGAKSLLQAFKCCPDSAVPAAAAELVLVGMKAATGSFVGLDRMFEYLSYGPKGKSGTDNIPDPFQGL